MKKRNLIFTAMLFAVLLSLEFVSCDNEKDNEPNDPSDVDNNEIFVPKEPLQYTVTVISNDTIRGTVTGNGIYEEGTEVTIVAKQNIGFEFIKWSDGNTDSHRVLVVEKDTTIIAEFDIEWLSVPSLEYNSVDLGLSVKWATCNVGASSPEESGCYFAWGEVAPKTIYNFSTYKWLKGVVWDEEYGRWTTNPYGSYTKYCIDSDDGTVDNKTFLDPEDDAATVNMGDLWRMPTKAELQELIDGCIWTYTENYNGTGVKGTIVESKINTNKMFLPATGVVLDDSYFTNPYSNRSDADYMSNELSSNSDGFWLLFFDANIGNMDISDGSNHRRHMMPYLRGEVGRTVRGVMD